MKKMILVVMTLVCVAMMSGCGQRANIDRFNDYIDYLNASCEQEGWSGSYNFNSENHGIFTNVKISIGHSGNKEDGCISVKEAIEGWYKW